jgi:hypothetical protein
MKSTVRDCPTDTRTIVAGQRAPGGITPPSVCVTALHMHRVVVNGPEVDKTNADKLAPPWARCLERRALRVSVLNPANTLWSGR